MCLTVIGVGTKILYGVAAEIQSFEQCSEKSEGSSHVGIWGQSNPHRAGKLQVGKVLRLSARSDTASLAHAQFLPVKVNLCRNLRKMLSSFMHLEICLPNVIVLINKQRHVLRC